MDTHLQHDDPGDSVGTLGHILYANRSKKLIPEDDWTVLVQSIAKGDYLALHTLYERSCRLVFTLIMRITQNRETAEKLTVDVFFDIWHYASSYDPANDTVLGWIMNLARVKAVRFDQRKNEAQPHSDNTFSTIEADTSGDSLILDKSVARNLALRLFYRVAPDTGIEVVLLAEWQWYEPEWEEVSPGIYCKLLATDTEKHCVSMMVRLTPGVHYPPHTHAGAEVLHLLDGELWINERKLIAGDYNRAEQDTTDHRVWSRTGCTCVLITSTNDRIL